MKAAAPELGTNHEGDWDRYLGRGVRRQTVMVGRMRRVGGITVERANPPSVTHCGDCNGVRYDLGGPHAVRVTAQGRFDCKGRRL